MRGVKCEKSLYLNKHKKELRDELTIQQQAIFSQGSKVGELAQGLFPGGIDLSPASFYDFGPSIEATSEAIKNQAPIIYEAAFLFDGVLAAMDILVKTEAGYSAYEVKSSTEVKEVYLQDVALQAYVIESCGVKLADISIVYINNQYVKNGPIDIKELFCVESVVDQLQPFLVNVPQQINQFRTVLASTTAPAIEIGMQCQLPYACDFMEHCWKAVPEYSVFNLSRLSRKKCFELYRKGIVFLSEIPDNEELNVNQRMQIEAEKNKEPIIKHNEIERFVDELSYPIRHLDFETFGLAIPLLNQCKPYQQVVFQYSIHTQQHPNERPAHFEFLAETSQQTDFRKELIEQLIKDCGDSGDILVYNISFEKAKLLDLAMAFPEYEASLRGIVSRLKDLMEPFMKRWYYLPEMKGSYSIKKVLPAIDPDFENAYQELEISDGASANLIFGQILDGTFIEATESVRENLLKYCELDTLAMVRILNKLNKLAYS